MKTSLLNRVLCVLTCPTCFPCPSAQRALRALRVRVLYVPACYMFPTCCTCPTCFACPFYIIQTRLRVNFK